MGRKKGRTDVGFGARLRELREQAGLTQAQLADKAGCHSVHVSRMEVGDRQPTWGLVLALSAALGVECTAFVSANGKPPVRRPRGRPRKPHGAG